MNTQILIVLSVLIAVFAAAFIALRRRGIGALRRMERYIPMTATQTSAKKKSGSIYAALDKKMDKVPVLKTIFNAIDRILTVANVPVKTSEFLISIVVLMFTSLVVQIFWTRGVGPASILAILGSLILPFVVLNIHIKLRLGKMRKQLKLCISLLANSMKAGNSFVQALRHVSGDLDEPLAGQFKMLLNENLLGIPIETALNNMARRVPCDEMKALVRGVVLQQQTGSNLVHILNAIFQTLQDREEMRNKISVLTIQGKISGFVCVMVPVALFFLMSKAQDGYADIMMRSREGHYLLLACGFLILMGGSLIYKIVSFKF